MTDAPSDLLFNPLAPGYVDNPYPHLLEMQTYDPVHSSPIGTWMLFRYDDCFRLLRDPTMSVNDASITQIDEVRHAAFADAVDGNLEELARTSILNIDPPDHTRLRRLVSKAFTPRTIEQLRPRIEELVDHALDAMAAEIEPDVIAGLAFPLPFDVISEMLGMPESDTEQLRSWSEDIVKTIDPIISDDEIRAAVASTRAMDAYLETVIDWKRANPGDDLLTAMIEAEEDGDRMSTLELLHQVGLLFIAGHETTVNLIGTGISELLARPDQAALVRARGLDSTGIDELLRFVSPVQMSRRITLTDFDVDGQLIPAGTAVLAVLASSNRDPAKWGPTANELDLNRDGAGQHLSFGSGAHYCLGASLAKIESQMAIEAFLRRFPDAAVVEQRFNGRINLRGLDRLIVNLKPS